MIKALLMAVGLSVSLGSGVAKAGVLGDTFDSLFRKQNFVFLEEASPIFFYDLQGEGNKTRTGLVSPWYRYEFLTADAGWLTGSLDSTPFDEGTPLLGGTVHIDELVGKYFPAVTSFIYQLTPDSTHSLMKRVTIGYGFAHDFRDDKFVNGLYTGLTWKF